MFYANIVPEVYFVLMILAKNKIEAWFILDTVNYINYLFQIILVTEGFVVVAGGTISVTVGKQAYTNSLTFFGGCPSVVLKKVTVNVAAGFIGKFCTLGLRDIDDCDIPCGDCIKGRFDFSSKSATSIWLTLGDAIPTDEKVADIPLRKRTVIVVPVEIRLHPFPSGLRSLVTLVPSLKTINSTPGWLANDTWGHIFADEGGYAYICNK